MIESLIGVGALFGLEGDRSLHTPQDAMAATSCEIARELPQILRLEDIIVLLKNSGIILPESSMTGFTDIDRPVNILLALDPRKCALPSWLTEYLNTDEYHQDLYLLILNTGIVSHPNGVREIVISIGNTNPHQSLEYQSGRSIDLTYLCRYTEATSPVDALNGDLRRVSLSYEIEKSGTYFSRDLDLTFGNQSFLGLANLIDTSLRETASHTQVSENIRLTRDDTTLHVRTQGPITPLDQLSTTAPELVVIHLDHKPHDTDAEGEGPFRLLLTTLPFDQRISDEVLRDRNRLAEWLQENQAKNVFSLRRSDNDSKIAAQEVVLNTPEEALVYADFIISTLHLLPPTQAPLFTTNALDQ